jgi:hypothetical protein
MGLWMADETADESVVWKAASTAASKAAYWAAVRVY